MAICRRCSAVYHSSSPSPVPGSEGAASDYCVAICDEKDRPFLELFNQGLANIRANGIYDAILAKYADTL